MQNFNMVIKMGQQVVKMSMNVPFAAAEDGTIVGLGFTDGVWNGLYFPAHVLEKAVEWIKNAKIDTMHDNVEVGHVTACSWEGGYRVTGTIEDPERKEEVKNGKYRYFSPEIWLNVDGPRSVVTEIIDIPWLSLVDWPACSLCGISQVNFAKADGDTPTSNANVQSGTWIGSPINVVDMSQAVPVRNTSGDGYFTSGNVIQVYPWQQYIPPQTSGATNWTFSTGSTIKGDDLPVTEEKVKESDAVVETEAKVEEVVEEVAIEETEVKVEEAVEDEVVEVVTASIDGVEVPLDTVLDDEPETVEVFAKETAELVVKPEPSPITVNNNIDLGDRATVDLEVKTVEFASERATLVARYEKAEAEKKDLQEKLDALKTEHGKLVDSYKLDFAKRIASKKVELHSIGEDAYQSEVERLVAMSLCALREVDTSLEGVKVTKNVPKLKENEQIVELTEQQRWSQKLFGHI